MFVIGIDPGLTTTGFGTVHRKLNSYEVGKAGVIRTDKGQPFATRLATLFDDMTDLIEEVGPEVMAMERVFVNRNLRTATHVGAASGVIMLAAARAGLEVFDYTPTAVKAIVTGNGRASKVQVQQMVARRLGLDRIPSPADTADALAIALCHIQSLGNRLGQVKAAMGNN
ncbi:MAG: crossover junction endodeoxyribonuclease RuvC [Acidimicrobiia bacterium]|nr:crossover junction endodeoxyribonuclease RuvC [Acidimicrobiia bacterium]